MVLIKSIDIRFGIGSNTPQKNKKMGCYLKTPHLDLIIKKTILELIRNP